MFPLNSWASCFYSVNALESNQAAELLPGYHPLPKGTALAYPAWQDTAPAKFSSSFYVACISFLPPHVFLENSGGAQPLHPSLMHLLVILCNSPHPFPLPSQSFRSLFPFSNSPDSTTESGNSSALHHIPSLSSLACTLIWLLTPSSSIWNSDPYESLPWVPLHPALFFFISTLTSLKALFTNTVWSFLLPNFKLLLQSLQVLKLRCTCMGITHRAYIFCARVLRRNKDHLDGNSQQTPCAQPQAAAMETSPWSFAKQMKIKFCDE